MTQATRWPGIGDEEHSRWYIERFRGMAADGVDLEGEARLVHAMAARGSRVLDAGCGPGRTSGPMHAWGHEVVGIDIDPLLIEAARADHPGPRYLVGDLADTPVVLAGAGEDEPFDAAVCAGNVLPFVADGRQGEVLAAIASCLRPDAFLLVGFHAERYDLDAFDADARSAGFVVEQRFATWDVRPWRPDADFAVTVLRLPTGLGVHPDQQQQP